MRRPSYFLVVLITTVALFLSGGCFAGVSVPLVHQPTVTEQGDPTKLVNMASMLDVVEHSVLEIATTAVSTNIFGEPTSDEGAGSAFAIDSNGTLVTAEHVIDGANSITAVTIDGQSYTAQVVNADKEMDIAVLKIDGANIPGLTMADTSKLRVGQWVVAVGNPLGEGISAKQGIISRLGVTVPYSRSQTYHNMIEISAAINPGNSGGPVFNLDGEVIGITTIKASDIGVEGMGYAINMTSAAPVIQRLSAK